MSSKLLDVDPFASINDVEGVKLSNFEEKYCEAASILNSDNDDKRRILQVGAVHKRRHYFLGI